MNDLKRYYNFHNFLTKRENRSFVKSRLDMLRKTDNFFERKTEKERKKERKWKRDRKKERKWKRERKKERNNIFEESIRKVEK